MDIVLGLDACKAPVGGSAVTIGAYDGVHLGHRHVLDEVIHRAAESGLSTAVVTFDRHPATVVRPESAPSSLTDMDQKLELLAATGVDRTLVVSFDEQRAAETAEEFVVEVLVRALDARLVVVGEDFHFGNRRSGDVALLTTLGKEHGFEVVGLALEGDHGGGEVVSSTRIRELLAAGDVESAGRLLGRHHQVRGTVEHGDGRGGPELGYPTANVDVPAGITLPADGIYACLYERPDGSVYPAAASLGRRPTFYRTAASPLLEAYLLDFEGDLYGEAARVSFVTRLREERRFDSLEGLVAQMGLDVVAARAALSSLSS